MCSHIKWVGIYCGVIDPQPRKRNSRRNVVYKRSARPEAYELLIDPLVYCYSPRRCYVPTNIVIYVYISLIFTYSLSNKVNKYFAKELIEFMFKFNKNSLKCKLIRYRISEIRNTTEIASHHTCDLLNITPYI